MGWMCLFGLLGITTDGAVGAMRLEFVRGKRSANVDACKTPAPERKTGKSDQSGVSQDEASKDIKQPGRETKTDKDRNRVSGNVHAPNSFLVK